MFKKRAVHSFSLSAWPSAVINADVVVGRAAVHLPQIARYLSFTPLFIYVESLNQKIQEEKEAKAFFLKKNSYLHDEDIRYQVNSKGTKLAIASNYPDGGKGFYAIVAMGKYPIYFSEAADWIEIESIMIKWHFWNSQR